MAWLELLGKDVRISPAQAAELLRNEQDRRFLAKVVGG
jgi:hypothetical protein